MQHSRRATRSTSLQESLPNDRAARIISKRESNAGPRPKADIYSSMIQDYMSLRSAAATPEIEVESTSAMRDDLDFRSQCTSRSKFVKIAKREVTEFEKRYHFVAVVVVIVVVYKLRDRRRQRRLR